MHNSMPCHVGSNIVSSVSTQKILKEKTHFKYFINQKKVLQIFYIAEEEGLSDLDAGWQNNLKNS